MVPAVLDHTTLDGIVGLCRRAMPDAPDREELEAALFSAEQPAIVRGDPVVGVVATVEGEGSAFVRLLAVDPARRGQGEGHRLLQAAEADARAMGHSRLTVGADAPFFLWPGVPSEATDLLCLLERHHYSRVDVNFDMRIELLDLPADPGGHHLAGALDRPEVMAWMTEHWSNWTAEVLRALKKGNLLIARDADGITAFCAFEVNRRGFLGPVAVRPDLIGRAAGKAVLLGALHELQRRGRPRVDVVWVGPVVPYARAGGRVSNVYFVYRRELT